MGKFKTSNGFGVDGISSFFLKIGMPALAPVLCDIFNWLLTSGTSPQNRRISRVSPIYKDGNIDLIIGLFLYFHLSPGCLRGLFLIKCISTLLQINYSFQANRVSGLCTLCTDMLAEMHQ